MDWNTLTGYWPDFRRGETRGAENTQKLKAMDAPRLKLVSETLGHEPVTLQQVKDYLRVTTTFEDNMITNMAVAARRAVENDLDRDLVPKVWDAWQNAVPQERLWVFPRNEVTSLLYIQTYALDDSVSVFPTNQYQFNPLDTQSSIFLEIGAIWPWSIRINDAWQVRFGTGYDNVSTFTPEPIQQAILMICDAWYNNRGTGDSVVQSDEIQGMLAGYKTPRI